ncbi:hypothetical protein [Actinokineospora iranica]|uniref:Uncharacterized protein n=1 Tax=Actinokineospora iranica TaxID=1271860 RepID=A0A1G6VTG0_9PSEU|nr:hypothetical protein [Actinokineospora iranica]SDD56848.1 hypothetical protein SAMN05216174_11385 [Actinokineospora iranica]
MSPKRTARLATKWALTVPTMMTAGKRPRVDERAHHALVAVAIYADNDGRNILSASTLSRATCGSP